MNFNYGTEKRLRYSTGLKIMNVKNMTANDRQVLAKAMRNQVIEEFSIEEFLKNHEQLYLNIVN